MENEPEEANDSGVSNISKNDFWGQTERRRLEVREKMQILERAFAYLFASVNSQA